VTGRRGGRGDLDGRRRAGRDERCERGERDDASAQRPTEWETRKRHAVEHPNLSQ